MLTARDKLKMAEDIDSIIDDNATLIDIYIPKDEPVTGYNPLLQEYDQIRDENYNIMYDVPIDIVGTPDEQIDVGVYGTRITGKMIVHLPLTYEYNDDIVTIDIEEQSCAFKISEGKHIGWWVPINIKYRIGEIIVTAIRLAGR